MDLHVPVVPVSILGHVTRQQAADSCLQDRVARGAVTGSWAYCSWLAVGISCRNHRAETTANRLVQRK